MTSYSPFQFSKCLPQHLAVIGSRASLKNALIIHPRPCFCQWVKGKCQNSLKNKAFLEIFIRGIFVVLKSTSPSLREGGRRAGGEKTEIPTVKSGLVNK